jgi:hypothetical protein
MTMKAHWPSAEPARSQLSLTATAGAHRARARCRCAADHCLWFVHDSSNSRPRGRTNVAIDDPEISRCLKRGICPQCKDQLPPGGGVGSGSLADGIYCSLDCYARAHPSPNRIGRPLPGKDSPHT